MKPAMGSCVSAPAAGSSTWKTGKSSGNLTRSGGLTGSGSLTPSAYSGPDEAAASAQTTERYKRIFDKYDVNKSGEMDARELASVLSDVKIVMDKDNISMLLKRYDSDGSNLLDFEEFSGLLTFVLEVKLFFESIDEDKSGTVSGTELTNGLQQQGMALEQATIAPLVNLFSETHTSGVSQQEFFALMFWFKELEYRYQSYSENPVLAHYGWLSVMLGENLHMAHTLSETLKHLPRDGADPPTFDSFAKAIISAAVSGSRDPTGRRTKKAPGQNLAFRTQKLSLGQKKRSFAKLPSMTNLNTVRKSNIQIGNNVITPYKDSTFDAVPDHLPVGVRKAISEWKRCTELSAKPQLFVDGIGEGDVIQGALGDCWFLGALSLVAHSTEGFIEHLFVDSQPSAGRYTCRFYKDGEWRNVEVDDRLPTAHGRLAFASCREKDEYWVPIVEKAYAKLHGSYQAIESGSIADGLKDLTGEGVEIVLLDDAKWKSDPDKLWKTLVHNVQESFLMGCGIDISTMGTEHELACGLLVHHAYSIIDCQEVSGGKRLMRIRNPWGKGEWNGAWSDNAPEWTPALLQHFKYEFGNDGTFFMSFDDFRNVFNRMYVLRLLNDDQGEVWSKSSFKGKWVKGTTAGGCTNHPTFLKNPQYSFSVKQDGTQVFVNLSQPDLRYKYRGQHQSHKYEPIGMVVIKVENGMNKYRIMSYKSSDRVATSSFTTLRDLSFEFTVPRGDYIIVPCTFNVGVEMSFDMNIYSSKPVDMAFIQSELPTKQIQSQWKGATAGGCTNYDTFLNNPQFLLKSSQSGKTVITLSQDPALKEEAIGIYVMRSRDGQRIKQYQNPASASEEFVNIASVSIELNVTAGESYVVIPTTFDPNEERKFTLIASCENLTIEHFTQL